MRGCRRAAAPLKATGAFALFQARRLLRSDGGYMKIEVCSRPMAVVPRAYQPGLGACFAVPAANLRSELSVTGHSRATHHLCTQSSKAVRGTLAHYTRVQSDHHPRLRDPGFFSGFFSSSTAASARLLLNHPHSGRSS